MHVFELTELRDGRTAGEFSLFASLAGIDFFKGDCCFLIKTLKWLIVKLIQVVFFTAYSNILLPSVLSIFIREK